MWTEPSPSEELAEAIKKAMYEARPFPQTYYDDIEKFNRQGWDTSEEIHKKKEKLFEKLKDPNTSPSEYYKIMKEINDA